MALIDLTHPITSGMQIFPGDPGVHLHDAQVLSTDGVAVTGIQMGSHTGTHLDAPSHCIDGGRTVSDVLLDEIVGDTLVLHVPGLNAGEEIGWERIAAQVADEVPRIVLLATGWDKYFGRQDYLDHPVLGRHAANALWQRGMRVLAVDTLNPDRTHRPQDAVGFPVHEFVLGGDGLIVENVRGAAELPLRCQTGFFPLNLDSADGAPVRAVAWV